jgi:type I restriction enzyme R subunit
MPNQATESLFENTTLDRLKLLGYRTQYGGDIERDLHEVVLTDVLRGYLQRRYRHLPPQAVEQAIQFITAPQGVNLDRRNLAFQDMFRRGFILNYEEDGEHKSEHIYLADFEPEHLEQNDFLVVNQLTIQGGTGPEANTRRPDVIIYLNGLPLVLFELKSPWSEYADVAGAHNQIGHYVIDIPQLFNFNGFCIASDGNTTLHGVHSAGFHWFAPWKSIDGVTVEPNTTGSMKTLIEGLFPKERLLNYLRNFLLYEEVNDQLTKKGAKYHQFFAVNFAVEKVLQAIHSPEDKRAGVIWHTQGSGKSLEIVFLVGILRRWPGLNPSIVLQVDRNDLDNQLYDSFVAARSLVGEVSQAETIDDLRAKLQTEGGEVVCTTIEKFALKEGERQHPLLSGRHNLIVIADEAHRTQYGLGSRLIRTESGLKISQGFALNLRQALPHATFLGFTGTPIDLEDANTVQIFGDYIHVYDMQQAREDNAVVEILYEARHIPLRLENQTIDTSLSALAEDAEVEATQLEEVKAKWAAIEKAAGTKERSAILARDLLNHFNTRQEGLKGKAMIVCMSRQNCVTLYNALTTHPDCPPIKIVMTGNLAEDPPEWNEAGHITTKAGREAIKEQFIDPDNPLKLVIVCDMWLTGFDAPCVNTLYVDKLMKGHNLMQAIARVNRIFYDKPGGLIVDYIGIGDRLREATQKYTNGGGRGDLEKEAVAYFLHQLEVTRAHMPNPTTQHLPTNAYASWRSLTNIQLEDLCSLCYGALAADDQLKEDFIGEEHRLSKAFSLIKHLPAGQANQEEVAFYQMVRLQLNKLTPQVKQGVNQLERAVRDLLDESIAAQPAIDIFSVAGLDKPNVSILDDKFLAGFDAGESKQQDLQMRLLAKLLSDELYRRRRQNLARYRSFKETLDKALADYNSRTLEAQQVVAVMVEIRRQYEADEQRKADLNLDDEELAFYDVIALGQETGLHESDEWIASLVRDVVVAVRKNLHVDWTKPHRSDVHAAVQAAVGQMLRKRGIKGEQFLFLRKRLMQQAEATYADWPLAA